MFRDASDPDFRALVELIEQGKASLDAEPRYGSPAFHPNRQYVREMKRFGILPASFDAARDALDPFQTDQAYWKSFWYDPRTP